MTAAVAEKFAHLTSADGARAADDSSTMPGEDPEHDPEPLKLPTLAAYNLRVKNTKRSLSTLKTVWGTMLMQVSGLGPEMAQAIIDEYPTPSALNAAYWRCGGGKQAAGLLAGLHTSRTHTVGKVVSEKVYSSLFGHSLTPLATQPSR